MDPNHRPVGAVAQRLTLVLPSKQKEDGAPASAIFLNPLFPPTQALAAAGASFFQVRFGALMTKPCLMALAVTRM